MQKRSAHGRAVCVHAAQGASHRLTTFAAPWSGHRCADVPWWAHRTPSFCAPAAHGQGTFARGSYCPPRHISTPHREASSTSCSTSSSAGVGGWRHPDASGRGASGACAPPPAQAVAAGSEQRRQQRVPPTVPCGHRVSPPADKPCITTLWRQGGGPCDCVPIAGAPRMKRSSGAAQTASLEGLAGPPRVVTTETVATKHSQVRCVTLALASKPHTRE